MIPLNITDQKVFPAIIVLGYNRPKSIERLLTSLNNAHYPDGQDIPLYISLDCGEASVNKVCEDFNWLHGTKKLRNLSERKGVREHVFNCGDLSKKFGSIIMLEDDLMVSPFFYKYAVQSLQFYQNEKRVGGFSLYHHQLIETSKRAFNPIEDGKDTYFLQLAASWGQCWNADQWDHFRKWSEPLDYKDIEEMPIPWDVKKWPRSSWKKWFTAYLVDNKKYLVYPRFSHTTNFVDPGEHNPVAESAHQTLLDHFDRDWRFAKIEDSKAVYDSYCEIDSKIIKEFNPALAKYEFDVDLLGSKPIEDCKNPYILTVKNCKISILGFQKSLRPEVHNIIHDLAGNDISLAAVENADKKYAPNLLNELNYSFSVPKKLMGKMIHQHLESKPFSLGFRIFSGIISRKLLSLFSKKKKLDNKDHSKKNDSKKRFKTKVEVL